MTEHITTGAHGANRIDLAQYRDAIKRAPELIYHLAHLTIKGRYEDGQPTSRDMQSAPGRIPPLDQAELTFAWLYREAGRWIGSSGLYTHPIGHMVRRDEHLTVIGSRHILSSEGGAAGIHTDASELVRIILRAWPDIESCYARPELWGATVGRQWIADVDAHLLRPLAEWPLDERAAVPERARRCPTCGEREVWTAGISLDALTALCARCETVIDREAWATTDEAARILKVSERTIRRLIVDGVPSRRMNFRREVELRAARAELQMRDGRRILNLGNG